MQQLLLHQRLPAKVNPARTMVEVQQLVETPFSQSLPHTTRLLIRLLLVPHSRRAVPLLLAPSEPTVLQVVFGFSQAWFLRDSCMLMP